jgi:hypothetical protein
VIRLPERWFGMADVSVGVALRLAARHGQSHPVGPIQIALDSAVLCAGAGLGETGMLVH